MMNLENGMKLLNALKSGKFKKTKNNLKNIEGYCCLGVACEISGLGRFSDELVFENNIYKFFDENNGDSNNSFTKLTSSVQEWLGISSMGKLDSIKLRKITGYGVIEKYLDSINDSTDTFKEVIEVIENSLVAEYLFGVNIFY